MKTFVVALILLVVSPAFAAYEVVGGTLHNIGYQTSAGTAVDDDPIVGLTRDIATTSAALALATTAEADLAVKYGAATKNRQAAQFAAEAAVKALRDELDKRFPPPPPPPSPVNPVNPPAPPVPTKQPTLVLITAAANCPGCAWVESQTVPSIKAQLGSNFSEIQWGDPQIKQLYPGMGQIPAWVLTRADGTVERKQAVLTKDQALQWIGK
jgi:hypothetical protein